MPHAVSALRAARLACSTKPFLARGGPARPRCPGCRLVPSHCLCAWRLPMPTQAGFCLLMADAEPLKPSNTGWLVADTVAATHAFGWARTHTDPRLPALLADARWQPLLVFPQDYAAPQRVVHALPQAAPGHTSGGAAEAPRPLFILLDGTWAEARKMFRKTPCLDHLPVLHLQPPPGRRYQLRRSHTAGQVCTAEVAALCLELAGDTLAAQMLLAYLDVFSHHYLQARHQLPVQADSAAHRRLHQLQGQAR